MMHKNIFLPGIAQRDQNSGADQQNKHYLIDFQA